MDRWEDGPEGLLHMSASSVRPSSVGSGEIRIPNLGREGWGKRGVGLRLFWPSEMMVPLSHKSSCEVIDSKRFTHKSNMVPLGTRSLPCPSD